MSTTPPPSFQPQRNRRQERAAASDPSQECIQLPTTVQPTVPTPEEHPAQPPAFAPAAMRERAREATAEASAQRTVQEHADQPTTPQTPAPSVQRRSVVPQAGTARQSFALQASQPRTSPSRASAPQAYVPQTRPTQPAASLRSQPGQASMRNASFRPTRPANAPLLARRPRRWRKAVVITAFLAALLMVWPVFLVMDANTNLGRVSALSGAHDTPGTTYLLAGSDSREDGPIHDDTEGARSDSVMLVHVAPNGQQVAISLPRDTWVDIPGYGEDKLNAAYALEGPSLLVKTVEQLSGLTIDHYMEIGMGGVGKIVDAVGGVELCMDYDVDDPLSELTWTAGCHVSDGKTALAFARMRYADPLGDIGRTERQRQVVTKTVKTALSPTTLLNPGSALSLERAGARALTVDNSATPLDIFNLLRAFRSAGNNGMTGTPPIVSLNYETYSGAAVLLEDTTAPRFFEKLRNGTLTPADLQHVDQ